MVGILWGICEQWTQKISLRMSNIIDGQCVNVVTEEEQAVLNQSEIDLNIKMNMNDRGKDDILDI